MIPLVIGAVAVGMPIGWKFARYFISEDFEADLTNIQEKWNSQVKLLELSLMEPFLDKKVYGYYLYGLIKSNQDLLIKLIAELNTDTYINYYKNTFVEWEVLIKQIKLETNNALDRYLVYESLFKKLFDIPYNEENFFVISEKIKPYWKLTQAEIDKLTLWIINPIFNGWYDFEMNDIQVLQCAFEETKEKLSWIEKFQGSGVIQPTYKCTPRIVKKFTPPLTTKINNRNEGPYDAVIPWVLFNTIISKKAESQELMNRWFGVYDAAISQLTGTNASYVAKGEKVAGDLKDSATDFYANMKKEFRDLKNSLSGAYTGAGEGIDAFTTALTYGGIALGGYFLYDLFISDFRN